MSHLKGFSQEQLHKWGWKEGKGLGKVEDGLVSAIKVKRKNNKGGLGHDHGSDFTFNWWDHIFNKTASSIEVNEDDQGSDTVKINKSNATKVKPTLLVSNKKPCYQYKSDKPLLYGTFVSAGTTTIGSESNVNEDSSSNSNSDDSDEDFSSKDVLEQTFKKTGMTGHKAARHGFKLSGKLQRIHEQEVKSSKKKKQQKKIDIEKVMVEEKDSRSKNEKKKKRKKEKKKSVSETSAVKKKKSSEN